MNGIPSAPAGQPAGANNGRTHFTYDVAPPRTTEVIEVASWALDCGFWPVVVTSLDDPKSKKPGKAPIGEAWGKERRDLQWWRGSLDGYPYEASIGLKLGVEGGVIDVDVDDTYLGGQMLSRIFPGGIPETMGWRNAEGRFHLLFRWDDRFASYGKAIITGKLKDGKLTGNPHYLGLEIRIGSSTPGGQFQSVIPPSPMAGGGRREWNDIPEILPPPESLFEDLDRYSADEPKAPRATAGGPRGVPSVVGGDGRDGARGTTYDRDEVFRAIGARCVELAWKAGLRIVSSRPSRDGWWKCHAIGREDKTPSAGINENTGVYHDFSTDKGLPFFDLMVQLDPVRFPDWQAACNTYGRELGVTPAQAPRAPSTNGRNGHDHNPDRDRYVGRMRAAIADVAKGGEDGKGWPTLLERFKTFFPALAHLSREDPISYEIVYGEISRLEGFSEQDYDRIIREQGPATSNKQSFNFTDLGNAELMVYLHGKDIRYCHPWKKWLCWDGRRWAHDQTGAIGRIAKDAVRSIYATAGGPNQSDEERKRIARHALDSEKAVRIHAMQILARSEPGVPIMHDDLDLDPWLLNCLNGTLDLRTGELRQPCREDYITKIAPVEYDPGATCPNWIKTVDHVFDGDRELIGFFQRVCGLCLTGVTTEQFLLALYGTGANGKSTILGVLMAMLGPDYAMKAMPDLLIHKERDGHPTDKADLKGKRLVVAIETEEGRRMNETLVKELTGGDRIRARRMHEDPWEFSPSHKIMLCTNHMPEIRGTDHGIWRRIRVVPFTVTIPDDQQDKGLSDKLLGELPGVLAWCVRGCLEWGGKSLDPPSRVIVATDEYRNSQDNISQFIDECCVEVKGETAIRVRSNQLYEAYKEWVANQNDEVGEPRKIKAFGQAIARRGIASMRSNGTWYLGIRFKTEAETDDGTDDGTPGSVLI